jgi:hypothetical protein
MPKREIGTEDSNDDRDTLRQGASPADDVGPDDEPEVAEDDLDEDEADPEEERELAIA